MMIWTMMTMALKTENDEVRTLNTFYKTRMCRKVKTMMK